MDDDEPNENDGADDEPGGLISKKVPPLPKDGALPLPNAGAFPLPNAEAGAAAAAEESPAGLALPNGGGASPPAEADFALPKPVAVEGLLSVVCVLLLPKATDPELGLEPNPEFVTSDELVPNVKEPPAAFPNPVLPKGVPFPNVPPLPPPKGFLVDETPVPFESSDESFDFNSSFLLSSLSLVAVGIVAACLEESSVTCDADTFGADSGLLSVGTDFCFLTGGSDSFSSALALSLSVTAFGASVGVFGVVGFGVDFFSTTAVGTNGLASMESFVLSPDLSGVAATDFFFNPSANFRFLRINFSRRDISWPPLPFSPSFAAASAFRF
mmetsp:Transcript_3284/g.4739  ORF Transcript_3284/g.4739 Transcript_3284/m.4739 type:complete len:327 (-) Transcript_3284:5047-6027(-)